MSRFALIFLVFIGGVAQAADPTPDAINAKFHVCVPGKLKYLKMPAPYWHVSFINRRGYWQPDGGFSRGELPRRLAQCSRYKSGKQTKEEFLLDYLLEKQ